MHTKNSLAPFRRIIWLTLLVGVCFPPSQASASSFTVNPTQIHLAGRTTSSLLTLRNQSPTPLRFQLSVFSWDQSPSGEMQLQRTEDIVFFPELLTLAPNEERKIRVGTTTAFGPIERTYRIFVEELPPLDAAGTQPGAVAMLTTMGIPIFLRPAKPVAQAGLHDLRIADGRVTFNLRNTGTVHFVPQSVRVRAFGPAESVVLDQGVDSWYILAGGARAFDLPLPKPVCSQVASLAVDVQIHTTTLSERLDAGPAACAP
jgi:fimbrial chaperone protein